MAIKDTVIKSRSYRSFDESQTIPHEVLLELVDTARLCPSAVNRQPLKYRIVDNAEEVGEFLSITKWGGLLPNVKLPPDGHHPVAFIVMCCDTTVAEDVGAIGVDIGIAAQTIMLAAAELELGGCMLGAFDKSEASKILLIPKKYKPVLALALGAPDELVLICNPNESGDTKYFRDDAGIHFVPKKSLGDVIIE